MANSKDDKPVATKKPETKVVNQIAAAMDGAMKVAPKRAAENDIQEPAPTRCPRASIKELAENSPVQVLGKSGSLHFYLDSCHQMIAMKPRDHNDRGIIALFGQYKDQLYDVWPKWKAITDTDKETGKTTVTFEKLEGVWDPKEAAGDLLAMAAQKGIFNPQKNLMGRGGHRMDDGDLIYHIGDRLIVRDHNGELKAEPLGRRNEKVFAGGYPMVPPKSIVSKAGKDLQALIGKWYFKDELSIKFLMGWVMISPFSGALDWRPLIWIAGDSGMGKSSLQETIAEIIGDMISVSNTTAAGLWQNMGIDTLPIAVDEAEPNDKNRMAAVVSLAREAATGTVMMRGGSDHGGVSFEVKSCFLFSSILIPGMDQQDYNRMAFIDLEIIPAGADEPDFDMIKNKHIGQSLRHQFLEFWPKWDKTVKTIRSALKDLGHGGRGADVFGNLMAGYWVALKNTVPSPAAAKKLVAELTLEKLVQTTDQDGEGQLCLNLLMSSESRYQMGGGVATIGQLVAGACGKGPLARGHRQMNKQLSSYGLKIKPEKDKGFLLHIANVHQGLEKLMRDSRYANGVWRQAFMKLPNAEKGQSTMNFGGARSYSTVLPALAFLEQYDEEDYNEPAADGRFNNL